MPKTPPSNQHVRKSSASSNETTNRDAQNRGLTSQRQADDTILPEEILEIANLANQLPSTSLDSYEMPQTSQLRRDITVHPAKSDSTLDEGHPTLLTNDWSQAEPMICQTPERGSSQFKRTSTSNTYGIPRHHYVHTPGTQPSNDQNRGNIRNQGQTQEISYPHGQAQGAQNTYDHRVHTENAFSENWVDEHPYGYPQAAHPFDSSQGIQHPYVPAQAIQRQYVLPQDAQHPYIPTQGVQHPYGPSHCVQPYGPSQGVPPYGPSQGVQPYGPSQGVQPYGPSQGVQPHGPSRGVQPYGPSQGVQPYESTPGFQHPQTNLYDAQHHYSQLRGVQHSLDQPLTTPRTQDGQAIGAQVLYDHDQFPGHNPGRQYSRISGQSASTSYEATQYGSWCDVEETDSPSFNAGEISIDFNISQPSGYPLQDVRFPENPHMYPNRWERTNDQETDKLIGFASEITTDLNNMTSGPTTSDGLNTSLDARTKTIDDVVFELENSGVESGMLDECNLIVKYDNERVLEQKLSRMHEGYRIFYGNQNQQRWKLSTSHYPAERRQFVNFNSIELPKAKKRQSPHISKILRMTDLGIVVRYDPNLLKIAVMRLCQSHVFYYDPHDRSDDSKPEKLQRNVSVNVFSFAKYLEEHNAPPGDPHARVSSISDRITFVVGVKPCSKMALPKMQGLKIELIPYGVQILQGVKERSDSPLCLSEPSSLDTALKP